MTAIHIHRSHTLSLHAARDIAHAWKQQAMREWDMECRYEACDHEDTLHFSRPGVQGQLRVTATHFDMTAQLGFLFGAFKDRIESTIRQQLDTLLGAEPGSTPAHKARAQLDKA